MYPIPASVFESFLPPLVTILPLTDSFSQTVSKTKVMLFFLKLP